MSKTHINKVGAVATNGTGPVAAAPGSIGLEAIFDVTAVPGTVNVTLSLYASDRLSGKRVLLIASTARTTTGTERLRVYPGGPVTANVSVNDVIGDNYEAEVAHSGGTAFSYTVAISELASGA